ncbi:MAG TPA: alpha/beta hydrolase-fold protein [Longimicrobiales bacterium]|nr:alpha/beta hydrolase-fold protein [Longimicrobiales bacterium]
MTWVPEAEEASTRQPPPDVTGLAVERLVRGRPTAEEIDAFLDAHDVPVVEGPRVTFLYRGQAGHVRLRHWVYGLPSAVPFHRMPGTDLWYCVLELPEGSRVEYKLEVATGREVQWIRDPLNERVAHDPFGANSVCHGHGYSVPEWTQPDPQAPEGTLEDRVFHSRALDGPRRITLYRPARFKESRRYPLLLVHDGGDYLRYSGLKTVLDNLIHRLEIPGVVAALTHPPDRMEQYRASEAHARYLREELVPLLEAELPLVGGPEGRGLMGASLGAVASLAAAVQYPGYWGRLLLQSGSFAFADIGAHQRGPVFDPVADFVNRYRRNPIAVADKVFVSCGTYESLIYENRSLVPLLQGTGMDVRFVEARDGHNWENWRDRLREGLSWLFPGPLWLVYE